MIKKRTWNNIEVRKSEDPHHECLEEDGVTARLHI